MALRLTELNSPAASAKGKAVASGGTQQWWAGGVHAGRRLRCAGSPPPKKRLGLRHLTATSLACQRPRYTSPYLRQHAVSGRAEQLDVCGKLMSVASRMAKIPRQGTPATAEEAQELDVGGVNDLHLVYQRLEVHTPSPAASLRACRSGPGMAAGTLELRHNPSVWRASGGQA